MLNTKKAYLKLLPSDTEKYTLPINTDKFYRKTSIFLMLLFEKGVRYLHRQLRQYTISSKLEIYYKIFSNYISI